MTPEEAIHLVIQRFPFDGYVMPDMTRHSAHFTVATTVQCHLPTGSRILDFGCGPCDKTAVLQFLGFQCTGYDDLQDTWHNMPGNQAKILAFAKSSGIDFRLVTAPELPFAKGSFDMIMLHGVIEHLLAGAGQLRDGVGVAAQTAPRDGPPRPRPADGPRGSGRNVSARRGSGHSGPRGAQEGVDRGGRGKAGADVRCCSYQAIVRRSPSSRLVRARKPSLRTPLTRSRSS